MVEGDLLVGWGLVGGEDAADDVGAGSGAADVGELVVAEGGHGAVEVGGVPDREAAQEYGAARPQERLEAGPLGCHGRVEAA